MTVAHLARRDLGAPQAEMSGLNHGDARPGIDIATDLGVPMVRTSAQQSCNFYVRRYLERSTFLFFNTQQAHMDLSIRKHAGFL
jgi:hypothetical protein